MHPTTRIYNILILEKWLQWYPLLLEPILIVDPPDAQAQPQQLAA
jgi:hypothetical protein